MQTILTFLNIPLIGGVTTSMMSKGFRARGLETQVVEKRDPASGSTI